MLKYLIKNFAYFSRNFIGSHEIIFNLFGLCPKFKNLMVSRNTDICIEGFPRSANSFFFHAFLSGNPNLNIAHHLHVPMQVLRALKYNIPCVVLIRNPIDAISSLLIIDHNLSHKLAIQSYISFYKLIDKAVDNVCVSDFQQVIDNPQNIILNVNKRYGTNFRALEVSNRKREKIFSFLSQHHGEKKQKSNLIAVPSENKEFLKKEIMEKILNNQLYRDAEAIYNRYRCRFEKM